MIQITKYAEKINKFLQSQFDKRELHYTVTIQLNFSIDVALFMSDSISLNRDILKKEYLNWLPKFHVEEGDMELQTTETIINECDNDFKIYFEEGYVKFYVEEMGEIGDPGEDRSGLRRGPRYRLNSILGPSRTEKDSNLPPVVTFYSYKGGMGRTTTMMGFALWLSSKGKRVGIIDCDLEAPGYLNFFDLDSNKTFLQGDKNGFVEYMADYSFLKRKEINLSEYVVIPSAEEDFPEASRIYDNIFIVPGGNLNDGFVTEYSEWDNESEEEEKNRRLIEKNRVDYIEGLSRLNLSNPNVLNENFKVLIARLKKEYNVDVVLIDSRTGFNDIYGSVAFSLADIIVSFFGFSKQTMPGLRQLMATYKNIKNQEKNKNPLKLIICNSILPPIKELEENIELRNKWSSFEDNFKRQITVFCDNFNLTVPDIYPIHRHKFLEDLGVGNRTDIVFLHKIINNEYTDITLLYDQISESLDFKYENLKEKLPENEDVNEREAVYQEEQNHVDHNTSNDLEYIHSYTSLNLTKIILRNLKNKLSKVKNFAEKMDLPDTETFLYRDCMKSMFDSNKFIVRGFKGAGKTYIYQALGKSPEVSSFVKARAGVDKNKSYEFINVISFDGISNHPLKQLEEKGVFKDNIAYNISAFWQILTWNAIFSRKEFAPILEMSKIKDKVFELKGSMGSTNLLHIEQMLNGDVTFILASIEEDFLRLDNFLGEKRKLFIMYDGLDNVVMPKYWSKAISPLINKWGGNLTAYNNIHPKIFLRTDLFERIEGTNTERLRDNIVDIDWSIGEVFGYLLKLILGESDNISREAMWTILRRRRKKYEQPEKTEEMIKNYTRAIKNGLGQFPSLDITLKPLIEAFFGTRVRPQGKTQDLGGPWQYFEKQLSNAAGKISMRPFINTLTGDVLDKGIANSNPRVNKILSSEIYASREVRIKAANSYFNDLASEEDFTVDLLKFREFINSDRGQDYRKKSLSESEFTNLIHSILEVYKNDLKAVESENDLSQLLYASGVMKEVYKPGHKIYKFAPMYEYAWSLKGKDIEEKEINVFKKKQMPQDGDILAGIITKNRKNKLAAKANGFYYECINQYQNSKIPLGTNVLFTVEKTPKMGGGYYYLAKDLKNIANDQ